MSAADYLVRWVPDIVRASADDIARFGPQAARVRGLLNYLETINTDAYTLAGDLHSKFSVPQQLGTDWIRATDAAERYGRASAKENAVLDADMVTWSPPLREMPYDGADAIDSAATAEVVSDIIDSEIYRKLVNPLNTGRTLQERMGLMLPDQQGQFMQLIRDLRAVSPEDILAVERLNSSPNVDALLEMLGAMAEGQPLARRIKAAETLYRAGRGGRGMA